MSDKTTPRLTLLTSAQEGVAFVGKRFTLQPDGAISKKAAGNVWRWNGIVRLAPTAAGLARGLSNLNPDQAIALGAPAIEPDSPFLIGHSIRRTLEHFHHAAGPGWLLLDFDNGGMPSRVAQRIWEMGGVVAALERIWPELKGAARVVRYSSSAGVHRIGDPPPDLSDDVALGHHVFVLLKDQRQAKATLEALTLRAFALGLGWIKLSASGALLVRSIVDAAVGSPERLVFCGPPDLGEGLIRTVPHPQWQEGEAVDAPSPPPGSFAHTEILRLKAEAAPGAAQVERAWRKGQARKIIDQTGCTAREAIRAVRERLEGGVLADRDVLQLRDGSQTAVGVLLDQIEERITRPGVDRLAYSLPDPAEGRDYGATSATIFWTKDFAHPVLISHAHGVRVTYHFARYVEAPAKARPVSLPALPDTPTARAALGVAVAGFMTRSEAWAARGGNDGLLAADGVATSKPFEALAVHVGAGKTRTAIRAAADLVVRLNEEAARLASVEGRDPHPVGQYAVIYAGPTHEFLEQVARDFEALCIDGVRVAHLRGPQAADPLADGVQTMCRDADHYTMASAFLQRADRVCIGCEHRDGCSYRANRRLQGTVFLITHAELGLGRKAPPALAFRDQTVAALIVDEDATGSMVSGASGLDAGEQDDEGEVEPGVVKLADLLTSPTDPDDEGYFETVPNPEAEERRERAQAFLQLIDNHLTREMQAQLDADKAAERRVRVGSVLERVREAVKAAAETSYAAQRAAAPGKKVHVYVDLALLAEEMRARRLSPSDLFEAGAREWARRKECEDVRLSVFEYKERVGANLTIRPAQRLYATLGKALKAAGWDDDGFGAVYGSNVEISGLCARVRILNSAKAGMILRVSGVQVMGEGYASAATLLLDATAEPDILPLVWGRAPVITTIGVAEPRFDVMQDATRAGSKAQLLGYGSQTSLHAAKVWRERLARWIAQVEAQHPEGVLVIANLDVRKKLTPLVEELAPEAQIAWAHFNNLRGLNHHQSRAAVIVIGRTRPKPEDVALTLEALTGEVVADKAGVIAKGKVERLAIMPDGSHAMVEGMGLTGEPLALALARLIESAEVEQALGRIRAANRQDEDLLGYVLGDAVLERPVRLVNDLWSSVRMAGGVIGAQLDLGDVAFLSAPHAFKVYGEKIGRNLNTVKDAFRLDQIRRDLIAAVEGDPLEAETARGSAECYGNLIEYIYEKSVALEPPFDPTAAGLDPHLHYLARYFAPKTRMASYALIRVAAFGDAPLDLGEAKHRCAEMIRATAGVEPRDLTLHSNWGPQLSTQRLVIASPSGLLADLPLMRAPQAPARSWRNLQGGITALHISDHAVIERPDKVVTVFNQTLAAGLRLAQRGPRAA